MTRYCKLLYSRVNAYTRGAVEVLYAGAVEVPRGAVEVPRGAVEVRSWCGRGTLVVRSRYALGMVLVRSRYARGALPVRYVSLTFQRAILYISAVGSKNKSLAVLP